MSTHFLYILYSAQIDKYYVGETSDIDQRVKQHNSGFFKGSYTSQTADWKMKLTIPFKNSSNAKKAEVFIKRMKETIASLAPPIQETKPFDQEEYFTIE